MKDIDYDNLNPEDISDHSILEPFYLLRSKPEPYCRLVRNMTLTNGWEQSRKGQISKIYKDSVGNLFYALNEKVIEIEPELLTLIQDTETETKDFHSPYNGFFVNHKFYFKDIIINGFGIAHDETLKKTFLIFLAYNTTLKFEFFSNREIDDNSVMNTDMNDQEHKKAEDTRYFIRQIAYNIVNMINENNHEIEYIFFPATNNEKRIQRGKLPKSDVTYIRSSGGLKRYAIYYSQNRGTMNIRFLVRGHWKHFKDDRYINAKGKKTWVLPFYKGDPTAIDMTKHHVKVLK